MSKSDLTTKGMIEFRDVSLDLIDDPEFDSRTWTSEEGIYELAESIKARGVLQPVRLITKGNRYEIQAGSRRVAASRIAGLQVIPALVVSESGADNEINKLTENLFREDISPLDKSRHLHMLHDKFSFSPDALSKIMGVNKSRIWQLMGIQNFNPILLDALDDKLIGEHIARELNRITDDKKIRYLLEYCVNGGATIQTVKSWVAQWLADQAMPDPPQQDYTTPPQSEPYVPGRAKCKGCKSWFDPNALINITVCADCNLMLQDFFKRIRKLKEEEYEEETLNLIDHDQIRQEKIGEGVDVKSDGVESKEA